MIGDPAPLGGFFLWVLEEVVDAIRCGVHDVDIIKINIFLVGGEG